MLSGVHTRFIDNTAISYKIVHKKRPKSKWKGIHIRFV